MSAGRWKSDALSGTPQSFQIVILASAFAEDVHHKIAIIQKNPLGAGSSFAMRYAAPFAMKSLFNGLANGLNLWLALPGAQQKIFGERAGAGKIEDRDVHGLFILSRFHGRANLGAKGVSCHRYRACSRMYSSTRAGTSP